MIPSDLLRRLRPGMRVKIILAFFAFGSAVSVALAFASYKILEDKLFRELQGRARNMAFLTALSVDRGALSELLAALKSGAAEGQLRAVEQGAAYRRISDQLNIAREAEERLVRYVYIIAPGAAPGEGRYVADADLLAALAKGADAEAVSHLGQSIDIAAYPTMRAALERGENLSEEEFVNDPEFGVNSVSGYAPIFGADGKTPIALVGLDMIDSDVRDALTDVTRLSLLLVSAAILVALVTSIVLGALFTRGILDLERVVRRFGDRDFDVRAHIDSSDEVGRLGFSFNSMAETIQEYSAQLEKLLAAYGRFVPHDVLRLLGKDSILDVRLGDQVQRDMTVLFSDIRSFTTLSEQMTPAENFAFINSYLSRVGPVIRAENGLIDKYIGDAVMALFPTRADHAVKASLVMLQTVREYNIHRRQRGFDSIRIGVGLHTGPLMLGTVGEEQRMDATVISDTVNLASRLEGLTKYYEATLIVSEATLLALNNRNDFGFRFLDEVQVKGKTESIRIYEIYEADSAAVVEARRSGMSAYVEAVRHYRRGRFAEARELFEGLAAGGLDGAARIYMQRCTERLSDDSTPTGWRPVEALDSK
jgi:class 3 adenylate cyclase/HAMP domain-containing protein